MAFSYDRGIRLLADVMDVEEAGVLDCFVEVGSELQRVQVASEAEASRSRRSPRTEAWRAWKRTTAAPMQRTCWPTCAR